MCSVKALDAWNSVKKRRAGYLSVISRSASEKILANDRICSSYLFLEMEMKTIQTGYLYLI